MTAPSLDSFFSGGGGKSLSWKDVPIGTAYSGIIKKVHDAAQATDPATNLPATTRDGKARIQVRIDLDTNYRDPTDPDDDGSRGLYVGGWMTGAIGDAMRKAGVTGIPQVGATLTVRIIDRESNGPAVNPTNKFDAHYVPPAQVATGALFTQAGQQAGQQVAQGLAPLGPPPQQPVPQQPVPQQPVPQPNIGGTGYVQPPQQAVMQPPPQQAAPPQFAQQPQMPPLAPQQVPAALGAILARPEAISEAAWNTMDDATKAQLVQTMGNLPPF